MLSYRRTPAALTRPTKDVPTSEAPPLQPAPALVLALSIQRLVTKKELYNETCPDGSMRRGILGVSRATVDRWREEYSDFPENQNPHKRGRCLFWLPDIIEWVTKHRKHSREIISQ